MKAIEQTSATQSLLRNANSKSARRILVVDDDQDMRQMYSDLLGRSGYRVDVAEDGAVAWYALSASRKAGFRYDLLITDNGMPKVSGIELILKLRSENMELPIILATKAEPEDVELLKLSAVLVKPFTPEEILKSVEKALCKV